MNEKEINGLLTMLKENDLHIQLRVKVYWYLWRMMVLERRYIIALGLSAILNSVLLVEVFF